MSNLHSPRFSDPRTPLDEGISVVVPVYQAESHLSLFVKALSETMNQIGQEWEVILVDDCSPDTSWLTIVELSKDYPNTIGLRLSNNSGQHAALLAGIRQAKYSTTITMDDDLQHRPQDIPLLLAELRAGFDLVYATSKDEEHSAWRNLTSSTSKLILASAVGRQQAVILSAFRIFRTRLRDSWIDVNEPFVAIDVLLSWATNKVSSVEVTMNQRNFGVSGYTFRKLMKHFLNMATGYSVKPLRLVTYTGLLFSLGGFLVLGIIVIQRLTGQTHTPGFAFLASLITVVGGLQLFCLGILGEYLGRIHVRSTRRPAYTISEYSKDGKADEVRD